MTAETFAANLRAVCPNYHELTARALAKHIDPDIQPKRFLELWYGCEAPTPDEVTTIATALGCPVERLTVSREELEERLRAAECALPRMRAVYRAERDKARHERDHARDEIATLRARLDAAEAACAHVDWTCPGCAGRREQKPAQRYHTKAYSTYDWTGDQTDYNAYEQFIAPVGNDPDRVANVCLIYSEDSTELEEVTVADEMDPNSPEELFAYSVAFEAAAKWLEQNKREARA